MKKGESKAERIFKKNKTQMEPLLSQKFTNETNKLDEGEQSERLRL